MFFYDKVKRPLNYCFVIAEAGVNHKLNSNDLKKLGVSSSLEVAYRMVDIAKNAGVDAIKFQSFYAEKLIYEGVEKPEYQRLILGDEKEISYFNLIKSLETSEEDQIKIANYCREKEIIFLSTPYDEKSADFLDAIIDVKAFKLASIELNNHLFIKYVANKKKPIILSTGLSNFVDVKNVVEMARQEGFADRLILLQCTSNYPTKSPEINLNVIKTYRDEFPDIEIGFSDHSPSFIASIGAVALGAIVIEKHFTLDKSFEGPDHSSSLNPKELNEWVKSTREISVSLGSYEKKLTNSEKKNLSMRKYVVIIPQEKDQIIEEKMLTTMRTGKGILPINENLMKIIGKRLKIKIDKPIPLSWDMIY